MFIEESQIAKEYNGNTIAGPLEWGDLWSAMMACENSQSGQWVETTEKMFWDMLGAVPPAATADERFLVGEAHHYREDGSHTYACFVRCVITKRIFARYLTFKEFRAL